MEIKVLTHRWKPKKKLGFLFDNLAVFELCKLNNVELFEMDQLTQEKVTEGIFYAAYVSYCKGKYKKPKYSWEQINTWVGMMPQADVEALSAEFVNSRVFGKPIKEYAAEESKKNNLA